MNPFFRQPPHPRYSLPLALSCLLLAACATPLTIPDNSTLADASQRLGTPGTTCPLPDGGVRAVWSQQPQGQYAWAMEFNAAGQLVKRDAVLTDASFARLGEGSWTPDAVRCAFGPPADIGWVGVPSQRVPVWSYRYRENDVWNSVMYVYFDASGEHVTHFNPGPDPRFEDNPFWAMFAR